MLTTRMQSKLVRLSAAAALSVAIAASAWAQHADPAAAPAAAAQDAHHAAIRAELEAKRAADEARQAIHGALTVAGAADNADGQTRAYFWANRKGKKEKAAYLGVTTTAADAAMRDQLKLPRGVGLVVQTVEESSPAGIAGLREHDILTKLNDQWLVNAPQFGVVVRMNKAGDEVTLTVIRQGETQTLKAKLAEKEMHIADNDGSAMAPVFAQGTGGFEVNVPDVQALARVPGIRQWQAFANDDDADIIIKENDRTMKVKVKDGQKHLVVTDNEDKVLFEGPIETDEQRKALPADIAADLDKYQDQLNQLKDLGPGQRKKIRIFKSP